MPLPKGEASFRRVYRRYVQRAKDKGIEFTLDQQTFRQIGEQNCTYCNAPPTESESINHKSFNGRWKFNGIDRIDNDRGYVSGNVQPCCSLCNQLKSNLKEKDFLSHIQSIVSHRESIKED